VVLQAEKVEPIHQRTDPIQVKEQDIREGVGTEAAAELAA